MSSRTNNYPETSPEYMRTLAPELAEALREVYSTMYRPAPPSVEYGLDPHGFSREEMNRILETPYQELTYKELYPILMDAFNRWGTWPDLAYFIPRLLEYGCWNEDLNGRLVEAAHADLASPGRGKVSIRIGSPMRAEERRSIFRYFQAYLAEIVGISNGTSGDWIVPSGAYLMEQVGFLATFDTPIEPFMLRWRESFRPGARAHYSLLLAELIMQEWLEQRVFINTRLWTGDRFRSLAALPENEEFLVEQLRPARVVEYLARAADDFEVLKPRERQQIELAFDWMAALA